MNHLLPGMRVSASGGARPGVVVRDWSAGGVEVDRVSEALELRDEPSGVGGIVASGVPVGAEVAVGLVAASMWNAAMRMLCATAT